MYCMKPTFRLASRAASFVSNVISNCVLCLKCLLPYRVHDASGARWSAICQSGCRLTHLVQHAHGSEVFYCRVVIVAIKYVHAMRWCVSDLCSQNEII